MSSIFHGERPCIDRSQLTKAFCPQIDGLFIKDIIAFIKTKPDIAVYFPEEEDIPKCGKEWVSNMLASLCNEEFEALVKAKVRDRRDKIDSSRKSMVSFLVP